MIVRMIDCIIVWVFCYANTVFHRVSRKLVTQCWLAEYAESISFHGISRGKKMCAALPCPSAAFVPDFAYHWQDIGKYMASSRACEMLARCLPSACKRLFISDARVCLHRGNSDATPMVQAAMMGLGGDGNLKRCIPTRPPPVSSSMNIT